MTTSRNCTTNLLSLRVAEIARSLYYARSRRYTKSNIQRSRFYLVYAQFPESNLICHTLRATAKYGMNTADKAKRSEPSQVTSVSAFRVSPTRRSKLIRILEIFYPGLAARSSLKSSKNARENQRMHN